MASTGAVGNIEVKNTRRIRCGSITLQAAADGPQRLPAGEIPDGHVYLIKSSPGNAVGSFVMIAGKATRNISESWPIAPGEIVGYRIKDSWNIWVFSTNFPSTVFYTVESD
jgi:hypothetical protein